MRKTFFIIILYMMTLLPADVVAEEERIPYEKFTFSYTRGEELFFQDYNGDELLDVIIQDGRRLKFHAQKAGNRFDTKNAYQLDIPTPYSHYDFKKDKQNEGRDIALLCSEGIDILRFENDRYTSPPKRILSRELSFLLQIHRINLTYLFLDIDGDETDDLVIPIQKSYCIYLNDDYSTPALRIPMEEEYQFFCREFQKTVFQSAFYTSFRQGISSPRMTKPKKNGIVQFTTDQRVYTLREDKTFRVEIKPEPSLDSIDSEEEIKKEKGFTNYRTYDFNQDGKKDQMSYHFTRGTLAPKTVFKIYLSRQDGSLPDKPESIIRTSAICASWYQFPVMKVDDDDYLDLVLLNLDYQGTSLESNLKAFVKRGLSGKLDFYLWQETQGYPKRPSFSFPIQLKYQPFGHIYSFGDFFRTGGDLTGDGKPDLLILLDHRNYMLHAFVNRDRGFSKHPTAVFKLPSPYTDFEHEDLNQDGIEDLIFTCRDPKSDNIFLDVLFLSVHKDPN